MEMEMQNEKVLLKPSSRVNMRNGVYLPETSDKMTIGPFTDIGEVISIGKLSPIDLKKGQKVLYDKVLGYEFDYEGEKYFMASSYDILAVLDS